MNGVIHGCDRNHLVAEGAPIDMNDVVHDVIEVIVMILLIVVQVVHQDPRQVLIQIHHQEVIVESVMVAIDQEIMNVKEVGEEYVNVYHEKWYVPDPVVFHQFQSDVVHIHQFVHLINVLRKKQYHHHQLLNDAHPIKLQA
jgi:hypothetical protein